MRWHWQGGRSKSNVLKIPLLDLTFVDFRFCTTISVGSLMNWSELVSLSTNTTFSQWCRSAPPWAGLLLINQWHSENNASSYLSPRFLFQIWIIQGFHICRYWHDSQKHLLYCALCCLKSFSEKKILCECRLGGMKPILAACVIRPDDVSDCNRLERLP